MKEFLQGLFLTSEVFFKSTKNITSVSKLSDFRVFKISIILFLAAVMLILLNITPVSIIDLGNNKFNLDLEGNIPSWFSSTLLFSISIVSLIIYFLMVENGVHRSKTSLWLLLCCGYLFLSIDESASIHEIFDRSVGIKWIFIYAPFAAVFFLFVFYKLVKFENNSHVHKMIIGGLIVFAIGGLGAETFSYYFDFTFTPIDDQIEIVFEEGLEMFGSIMVLLGCLIRLELIYNKLINADRIIQR